MFDRSVTDGVRIMMNFLNNPSPQIPFEPHPLWTCAQMSTESPRWTDAMPLTNSCKCSKFQINVLQLHFANFRQACMGMNIYPVKAELVFAEDEKRRMRQKGRLRREGYTRQGEDISNVLLGCWYVDDLLLASGMLCCE